MLMQATRSSPPNSCSSRPKSGSVTELTTQMTAVAVTTATISRWVRDVHVSRPDWSRSRPWDARPRGHNCGLDFHVEAKIPVSISDLVLGVWNRLPCQRFGLVYHHWYPSTRKAWLRISVPLLCVGRLVFGVSWPQQSWRCAESAASAIELDAPRPGIRTRIPWLELCSVACWVCLRRRSIKTWLVLFAIKWTEAWVV